TLIVYLKKIYIHIRLLFFIETKMLKIYIDRFMFGDYYDFHMVLWVIVMDHFRELINAVNSLS
ncbi:MAG TPA: hypothetical protein DCZ48_14305, partial [Methylococcaceae bacterium]|nr:hypothetical protein [Methylococcaceae bacterium]